MSPEITKDIRALAFGLMEGIGGVSYPHRQVSKLLYDKFGVNISTKTLRNWKSDKQKHMVKYGITTGDIQEVVARGLAGDLRDKGTPKDAPKDAPRDDSPGTKEPEEEPGEPESTTQAHPFTTAEAVSHLEKQGFIVATSDQDLRDILDKSGLTLLEKGALRYGPEIISVEPIELDFELVGKQIAGNTVIMWYYALARKLAMMTGEKPPELVEYVTGCVVDAMVARRWNMAVLRA